MSEKHDENPKRDVAIFRYGVISDFVNGSEQDSEEKKAADKGEVRPEVANTSFRED